ncbi:MAG: anthranilate synthase component I family protein [Crocinitomicaceae bacterium]|nr:anthranilate synthase component I family protein [Crocinitomicaceae bacterium]
MRIYTHITPFNADIHTPVKLYLSLRNHFRKSCLLESNDYQSRQNSKSFIGFEPIIEIQQVDRTIEIRNQVEIQRFELHSEEKQSKQIQKILNEFTFEHEQFNGLFGRLGFEMSQRDETHIESDSGEHQIPLVHLSIFRYVIVIDHFTNEGFILENSLDQSFNEKVVDLVLKEENSVDLPFELFGNERAEFTDTEFEQKVIKGIDHCRRGDVFQLVLSNAFEQSFFGDDFQVYRQLRRLNPSPYLFYFDFEEYRVFGSSPEAQLIVKNGEAEIHPIAGTIPNTGIKTTDDVQLKFLLNDEKENAEHTMLVDLARNDLSRDCTDVKVESYKEIQRFSHVTHLVSKVKGRLKNDQSFEALCNSFPAGTLSGTPKPRALELIHKHERSPRDFYGGAIGLLTPNRDVNMAIVIRSVLSKNNILHYRAGAGIVLDSEPSREVQEVHHKLRAIRSAILKTQAQFDPIKSAIQ